jgi:hypothetical protein
MQPENSVSLTLHDLVVLKQFLEKGFRESFFNGQEMHGAVVIREKISSIIQEALVLAEKSKK